MHIRFIMIFILLALIGLYKVNASYGIEYLGFDLELHFILADDEDNNDVVTFELWIPKEYTRRFGWIGIALQDILDPMDNFRADYYIALTSNGLMTDRYATYNGFSEEDVDQGCTDDIVAWSRDEEHFAVYIWERKLTTGDDCDIDLFLGKPMLVKYAMGPVIDGVIEQHSMKYMGYEYLLLSPNYVDNNEDERGLYGPWHTDVKS